MIVQDDVRALEFFAGIGGFAQATESKGVEVVAALDMSSHVLELYAYNFNHVCIQKNLEVMTSAQIDKFKADLWWMSPPCQPYTVRGLQKDLEDHRAKSFLNMLDCLKTQPPMHFAMENVAGFHDAQARRVLLKTLESLDFEVSEQLVCPTQLGVPARRSRYYLVASRAGLNASPMQEHAPRVIRAYIEEEVDDSFIVDPKILEKHGRGMRLVVDIDDPQVHTNCFTSAYGKTYRYSGSYYKMPDGRVRYFTPRELLRFLGYPDTYQYPAHLSRKQLYKYIGNSLSIDALHFVLAQLPI